MYFPLAERLMEKYIEEKRVESEAGNERRRRSGQVFFFY